MNASPVRALAAGMAAAALLVALVIFFFARRDAAHAAAFAGTPIDPPKAVNDVLLVDQDGKSTPIFDPHSAATFVFFGYTRCPDECPLAMATLARAYRELPGDAREKTRIVFVTVDPAHDTPAALGRYARNFDAHIVALSGTKAQLSLAWDAYGVDVEPQAKELVGHGGTIYGLDRSGRVVLIYPPDVKAADLTNDAEKLAG